MTQVLVQGIDPRIDGEYEFITIDDWTIDEWLEVKQKTGLIVQDFLDANESGRSDIMVLAALAMVSCARAGKPRQIVQLVFQAKYDNIDITKDKADVQAEEAEEAALPPAQAPTGSTGNAESASGSLEPVGDSSTPHSNGQSENHPGPIGVPI